MGTMNKTAAPADLRTFLTAAVRRQRVVGAIAPSSPALGRALSAVVPALGPSVVVGTGGGHRSDQRGHPGRLAPGSRQLAVEIDPGMAAHLRRSRKPWMETIEGDAADLGALLAGAGVDRVDAVVSTLPWSLFPGEQQERILAGVGRVLAPSGAFTTVTYLSALPLAGAGPCAAGCGRPSTRS